MPGGGVRFWPFALVSTALHAVVLVSVPEPLGIAVSPPGHSGSIAVRLIAAGPPEPEASHRAATGAGVPHQPEAADTGRTRARPDTASAAPERTASPAPEADEASDTNEASAKGTAAADDPARAQRRQPVPDAATSAPSAETSAAARSGGSPAPQARDAAASAAAAPAADAAAGGHAATPEAFAGEAGRQARSQLARRARRAITVRIREHFRYPRIARQRGWEGEVVLAFRVHADGRISDVEVVRSSGRAVLDESARRTLIRIGHIPALADQLRAGPLELEVPVAYRLQPA